MDSLRWILLGIGVLVIAGIYLWSRRPRRPERIEPRFDAMPPEETDEWQEEVYPGEFDVGADPALESEVLSDVEPRIESETEPASPAGHSPGQASSAAVPPQGAAGPQAAPQRVSREPRAGHPEGEEKIVAFYLVAPRGEPFRGPEMLRAFETLGLEYGDMQIYHRMAPGALKRKVFSVANLTEPGTFDPANIDDFTTPGLTLFMQLPGPIDSVKAFDDLDATARKLASLLDGDLRDETRSPLSRQRIESLREEVAEFERRQQLAMHQ